MITPKSKNSLTDEDRVELDVIMARYVEARETAKNAFLEAQRIYHKRVSKAAAIRDQGILGVVGERRVQRTVAEFLGMNHSYLASRLRKCRESQRENA